MQARFRTLATGGAVTSGPDEGPALSGCDLSDEWTAAPNCCLDNGECSGARSDGSTVASVRKIAQR
jgi:hypothetical protein